MLEAKIEAAVMTYAKEKGFLVYKFVSPNMRSVPDRLLIHPTGYICFCEFKAAGKKPTVLQEREHLRMRAHNVAVYVVDEVEMGKRTIDQINVMCLGC